MKKLCSKFFGFVLFFLLMQNAFADLFSPSTSSNSTNTTTNTAATNNSSSNQSNVSPTNTSSAAQDSEAVKKFFQDATYENFAPEEPVNLFDPSYLEPN